MEGPYPVPWVRHAPAGKPYLKALGQHLCIASSWDGRGLSPWQEQGIVVGSVNPETCPRAGADTHSLWSSEKLGWCMGLWQAAFTS